MGKRHMIRRIAACVCCLLLFSTALFGCSQKTDTQSGDSTSSTGETTAETSATKAPLNLGLDRFTPKAEITDTVYNLGLCISEWGSYTGGSLKDVQTRFDLYKEAGFKTLRLGIEWRTIEQFKGTFSTPMQAYMLTATKKNDFRLKMCLGTIMGVPQWYFQEYPDAYMVNQVGTKAVGTPSYFAPNLRENMENALKGMLEYMKSGGLLDYVDAVVVDCGPAGEPLYPPAWTQQADGLDNASGIDYFWGYDVYSQQNFRETMQSKYGSISAANTAWSKSYGSFDDVEAPKPGTGGGQLWKDWLTWYRDSKRDFVIDQVEMYQRLVNEYSDNRIKLILYIPGSEVSDEQWEAALKNGDGDGGVRIMADSRFLIDTAKEYGLYLQYTGFENAGQTTYLRKYMDETGAGDIPFFGENAGGYNAVKNGAALAKIVAANFMSGIDVTHSRWMFEKESSLKPAENMEQFKQVMDALKNYLRPESAG